MILINILKKIIPFLNKDSQFKGVWARAFSTILIFKLKCPLLATIPGAFAHTFRMELFLNIKLR